MSKRVRIFLATTLLGGLAAASALAHPGHGTGASTHTDLYSEGPAPKPYAKSAKGIAYYNTPNRSGVPVARSEPTTVGAIDVKLDKPADVLVNFSSGLAAESSKGCPCSVRVSLKVDDQPLLVLKRINVGAPSVETVDKYEHDRQPADGSTVLPLPAGAHKISLVYHQVGGESDDLAAYYVNLQAIPFPN